MQIQEQYLKIRKKIELEKKNKSEREKSQNIINQEKEAYDEKVKEYKKMLNNELI